MYVCVCMLVSLVGFLLEVYFVDMYPIKFLLFLFDVCLRSR